MLRDTQCSQGIKITEYKWHKCKQDCTLKRVIKMDLYNSMNPHKAVE